MPGACVMSVWRGFCRRWRSRWGVCGGLRFPLCVWVRGWMCGWAVFLGCVAGLPALRAAAQALSTGAVRGRLLGADGIPVPGVRLVLRPVTSNFGEDWPETGTRSGAAITVSTDREGAFTILGLWPGVYEAELWISGVLPVAGWANSAHSTDAGGVLHVDAGETAEVALRVRSDGTGLTARAVLSADGSGEGAVLIRRSASTQAASRGSSPGGISGGAAAVSGGDPLQSLPVEDRQWEALGATNAAAHEATTAGAGAAEDAGEDDTASARAERETGSAATGLSTAGLPAAQDAETIDGLSADQGFRSGPRGAGAGGSARGSGFAQGAVRSVRVMPGTFSAQYGGAAGALVAAESRRAGAEVHGSAFFGDRESAWAATNPFAVVSRYQGGVPSNVLERPAVADRQFGGALGLPLLRRGRMGVFAAYEGQRRSETIVSSPQTAGFFQLSAMQTALLANRGVGAAARRGALEYIDGLGGVTTVQAPRMLGFVRLDAGLGRSDRVSFGGQAQRLSAPALGGTGVASGVVSEAISSIGSSRVEAEAANAGWEHRFGTRATNSVRVQVAHDLEYETPGAADPAVPAIGPGGYAPEVLIEPEGFRYGTPASLGRVAYPDEHRVQAVEGFQVRAGRHLIALGGDWSRLHDRVLAATNLDGTFLYDSGTTGGHAGGLVDWITDYTFNVHAYPNGGCPSILAKVHYFCFRSYSQSFANAPTEFVTHNVAGFAEDSVRLRANLNLTFGVRYDYLLLPFPQVPNRVLDGVLRGLGGGGLQGTAGLTSSFPEDRNNFAPRVSMAWSPGGFGRHGRGASEHGFTVRAGYGMFYGRLPGATIQAALADTALPGSANSTNRVRILPTTETNCPQVAEQGFGYPCAFFTEPAGVVSKTGSAAVFSNGFRLPAVQRGSFALQKSLGRHVLIEGAYATAWATQLSASVDVNVAPSTGTATYILQGGDGHPGVRTGETFQVPLYSARRTALYGPVTAIESNANATFHSGTATAALREWHGISARGSYVFSKAIDYGPQSSPTPRQNGQFDPFTNGFDKGLSSLQFPQHFAGSLTVRSEFRAGPRELRALLSGWRLGAIGTAGSGAPYSYVVFGGTRLVGGHESINGSGGAAYLPTAGRNTLRLPMRGKVDLRLARELPMGGRWRLELRADAFNLLNSVSLSRVETRAFLLGTPAGAGAPTPLVFQDAAAIASEGISTPAFGTPLSSTAALSRERQVEVGARVSF